MKRKSLTVLILMLVLIISGCGKKDDSSERKTRDDKGNTIESNAGSIKADDANLSFELQVDYTENATCIGTVTAYDEEDNECWRYDTGEHVVTELDTIEEIGKTSYGYIIVVEGTVICFDANNSNEANILWQNDEFQGAGISFCFDEDENLLMCGYYSPDLFVIDKEGNTVCKVASFEEISDDTPYETYRPYDMKYEDGVVYCTFESNNAVIGYDYKKNEVVSVDMGSNISFYDYCHYTGEYTDDCDNTYSYSYILPYIDGANTDDAKSFNKEMSDIADNEIASELETMEDGCSLAIIDIGYELYETPYGFYSVVVSIDYDYDYTDYFVYNFTVDGYLVDRDSVLSSKVMTEDEFFEKAKEVIKSRCFDNEYSIDDSDMWNEMEQATYDGLKDSYVFINDEDQICFITILYVPAGAGAYPTMFVLEQVYINPHLILLIEIVLSGDFITPKENIMSERFKLHFEPQKGWMNDPNGLVWYRGYFHAFFY